MDAPYYNGEPGRGERSSVKRGQWYPNCHICHEHTIGHSIPVDGVELAICPNCYANWAEAGAARLRKGAA